MYRKALWYKYGFEHLRDCVVRVNRMTSIDDIKKKSKRFLLPSNVGTVRSNVIWIPAPSSTLKNSAAALSALTDYRKRNGIELSYAGKNRRRQRAKSMFFESTYQMENTNGHNFTMDDMHVELAGKFNSPNHGLKPCSSRQVPEPQSKPLSQCEIFFMEMKAKLAAKNVNENE